MEPSHDSRLRTGAIIQARMSSTRLPGKVLKELPFGSGVSDLVQVVRRVRNASSIDSVIVATSTGGDDDAISVACEREGVPCFRGSLDDVLSRYVAAAVEHSLDIIIRVTSDCPCIDPTVIDMVVEKHLLGGADLTTNNLTRTFPHGLDVEAVGMDTLMRAHEQATSAFDREHVCTYLERDEFTRANVEAPRDWFGPDIQVTLDTQADYAALCAVYDFLGTTFDGRDIVTLFKEKPWLALINPAGSA